MVATRRIAVTLFACSMVMLVGTSQTDAQGPPVTVPARWSGSLWGTVEAEPKVARAGEILTLTATTHNGGAGEPDWTCTDTGWHEAGTASVAIHYSSSCFEVVDYEPTSSSYLAATSGASTTTWRASGEPLPPAWLSDDCYCRVDGWGASSVRSGCPTAVSRFRKGQTFVVRLKVRNGCRGSGWTKFDMADFSGWNGVAWADSAEGTFRIDGTFTPAITLAATPRVVPVTDTSTLRAVVTDTSTGAVAPQQTVHFGSDVGLLSSMTAITDDAGVATVTLASDGTAGTATPVATVARARATTSVEFTDTANPGTPPDGEPGDPGHGAGTVLRRYFAEGSTESMFTTDIALANPSTSAVRATLQFLTAAGTTVERQCSIPGLGRRTVRANDIPELGATAFSTIVQSPSPLVADRTMTWDATGYGSHAETSIERPMATWYFAEGATHSGLNLFYLLQNPDTAPVDATVTYLRPAPLPPVVKAYHLAPRSRFNIWVNVDDPQLASTDVSAVIQATAPIIAERAVYFDTPGRVFGAGHDASAIAAPAERWFFAEGATGPSFDLFILVANPDTRDARVRATYLLPDGTIVERAYVVAAKSRFNIWVDYEDARLADTAVSTIIASTNGVPVIAERALWWPGSGWYEAHASAGATSTATRWGIADGEQGGPRGLDSYILIANTSDVAGTVTVTLLVEDGASMSRSFTVGAKSRFNVSIRNEYPYVTGKRFGAIVESAGTGPVQLVVEHATYSNSGGVAWAAGTNALATPLPVR